MVVENFPSRCTRSTRPRVRKYLSVQPSDHLWAISGFGRTGPYKVRAGFDLIAQGMSGIMSVTGEGPGRNPVNQVCP
ncbi:MAG: hypothetical protein CM1200mP18_21210 [Gammaproteobacteria bacterium]|nr:MAG: hypothetical protein CM1200mP18_21210 [Gammaproteobacteria bacterium]